MENTTEIPTEEPKSSPVAWLFFFVPVLIIFSCFLCACISEDKRAKRAAEARRKAAQEITPV